MKALFVVPCYYPATRFGGPVKSIHQMGKALRRHGVEVDVFTTNSNGPVNLDVPLHVPVIVDGAHVTYFPVQRPRSYFRAPALRAALRREVAKYDVVYAAWMYVDTTVSAASEARRQGVPYVISPRGMLDAYAVREKSFIKKRAWLSLFGRAILRKSTLVHFTSRGEQANSEVAIEPQRAIVIPNGLEADGVALESGNLPALPDGPIVLFLGRLNYIKGLDMLADAWPSVVSEIPDATLVLAGPDDDRLYAALHAKFKTARVDHAVVYVGMVEPAAKNLLLRRCTVLANPSYLESFGMAIVEAMAAGKPVVITDRVNIAPQIDEAKAGIVVPCSPALIARAIITLIRDPALARRMGDAGRETVAREYALDAVARKLAAALHEAVVSRKGA